MSDTPLNNEPAQEPSKVNPILDPDAKLEDKIREFGRLKYPVKSILAALALDTVEAAKLISILEDRESNLRIAYEQGIVFGEAEIDIALREKAATGDTFAASELSLRQYYNRIDNLRNELFNL